MRTIAFLSAFTSYILFVSLVLYSAANYSGYSHVSQFISELGASGAPTEILFRFVGFMPTGILLMLFSFAAIKVLPKSAMTTLGFCLLGYNAFALLAAAFFPCDFGCRPESPSVSQIVHNLLGFGGYLAAIVAIFLLGFQSRKWQGLEYLLPVGLVCGLVAVAGLLAMDPLFDLVGIAQRILEVSIGLWTLCCAWGLRTFRTEVS